MKRSKVGQRRKCVRVAPAREVMVGDDLALRPEGPSTRVLHVIERRFRVEILTASGLLKFADCDEVWIDLPI